MIKFLKENVNPKKRITGDCATRALATVLGISWEDALKEQYEMSLKTHYDLTSKQVLDKVLEKYGYIKMKQPRKLNNTKYTVGEMDEVLTDEQLETGAFILIAHHATAIKDYLVIDIWDCRYKTVGNYWIKKLSN